MSLSGLWVGTIYNSTLNRDARIEIQLRQVGDKILGHMIVSPPLQRSAPVSGFVVGDSLTLLTNDVFSSNPLMLNATIQGNHMEGTYTCGILCEEGVISVDKEGLATQRLF